MSEYKPVPVEVAKQIARQFSKSMVVVLCYDPEHELTHTTTYGTGPFEKEQAAAVGQLCAQAIGSDLSRKTDYEDFHRDYDPARYRHLLEVVRASTKQICDACCPSKWNTDEGQPHSKLCQNLRAALAAARGETE